MLTKKDNVDVLEHRNMMHIMIYLDLLNAFVQRRNNAYHDLEDLHITMAVQ